MIVVDAAVLATAIGDDGPNGGRARARLSGEVLVAPELFDLEVVSAWRRLSAAGGMQPDRAKAAIADLRELPIERFPHRDLLERCWELRDNLTIYDAAYVALAEELGVKLITSDRRIIGASGLRCAVESAS